MAKATMSQKEIGQWMNFKMRGRSTLNEKREYERLDTKWETEKVDLIMKGARRLLLKLQS